MHLSIHSFMHPFMHSPMHLFMHTFWKQLANAVMQNLGLANHHINLHIDPGHSIGATSAWNSWVEFNRSAIAVWQDIICNFRDFFINQWGIPSQKSFKTGNKIIRWTYFFILVRITLHFYCPVLPWMFHNLSILTKFNGESVKMNF